jgi:hypothetical protein
MPFYFVYKAIISNYRARIKKVILCQISYNIITSRGDELNNISWGIMK